MTVDERNTINAIADALQLLEWSAAEREGRPEMVIPVASETAILRLAREAAARLAVVPGETMSEAEDHLLALAELAETDPAAAVAALEAA